MTKLYRSRTDRKVTGLCGGLSDTMRIDSNILRLIVVITAFFSGGVIIPLYFLAALVIPSEPHHDGSYGYGYGGHGANQWNDGSHWSGGYGHKHHSGPNGQYGRGYEGKQAQGQAASDLDDMMKDIEKKAMWKEIEELRTKVANYEKQQQTTKGDV